MFYSEMSKSMSRGILFCWICVLTMCLGAIMLTYQNCSDGGYQSALSSNSTAGTSSTGSNPDPTTNPNTPPPITTTPTIVSLLENKGPLFGDHLLKITSMNIPTTGKKVEIQLGTVSCLNLIVVSDKEIDCITPASTASKVDVNLLIDGKQASQIAMGYEYLNSESNVAIAADPTVAGAVRVGAIPVVESNRVYIWSGVNINNNDSYLASGSIYLVDTNIWDVMSAIDQPSPRNSYAAVSTGTELFVWGGYNGSYLNTGGLYNYATKTWRTTSTVNAPDARYEATAVWTGSKVIVWGGGTIFNLTQNRLNTGAIYDPKTDTWAPMKLPPANVEGRFFHFSFWDGIEMFVTGGYGSTQLDNLIGGYFGAYNPATDTWRRIDVTNGYGVYSNDFAWTWYTGTKFMSHGPVSSIYGIDYTSPKSFKSSDTAYINVPVTMISKINFDANRSTTFRSVWTGRYMLLFQSGVSGFKYSFP